MKFMNRVQINDKDVDSDLGCTSMVICGWNGVRVQNDHKRWVF